MTLQIKELHIKLTVNDKEQENVPTTPASSAEGIAEAKGNDALVALCVEQVMNILKEKMEP